MIRNACVSEQNSIANSLVNVVEVTTTEGEIRPERNEPTAGEERIETMTMLKRGFHIDGGTLAHDEITGGETGEVGPRLLIVSLYNGVGTG